MLRFQCSASDPFNFDADPHWKKWIRIQVISLRFTDFFQQQSRIFKFFVLFYSLTFMLKLDKPFKFYNLFFNCSYLDLESTNFNFAVNFWLIFCSLFPDLRIPIVLRIRIQEAKILRIQRIRIRIRILSTGFIQT